jgi:hypothetical protein
MADEETNIRDPKRDLAAGLASNWQVVQTP